MKSKTENLLKKINPNCKINWKEDDTNAEFEWTYRDKKLKGEIKINSEKSFNIKETYNDFKVYYLTNKLKNNLADFDLDINKSTDGITIFNLPNIGDYIVIKENDSFENLEIDEEINLNNNDVYYSINNSAIECDAISTLKRNFVAIVKDIFLSTCSGGGTISSKYLKCELIDVRL